MPDTSASISISPYSLLQDTIKKYANGRRVVVAVSGGVDSAVVLSAAASVTPIGHIRAVHFTTPLVCTDDLLETYKVARHCQVQLEKLMLDPLGIEAVANNATDRCYHCKTSLFSQLIERFPDACILDGSNASDDSSRPGLRALTELNIFSPLRASGITKAEVREMAEALELPNAFRPSAPCLATRLPYNTRLENEWLHRVSQAEDMVRAFGFKQFRVRSADQLSARIEVFEDELHDALNKRSLLSECLQALGFQEITVDENGYRMT